MCRGKLVYLALIVVFHLMKEECDARHDNVKAFSRYLSQVKPFVGTDFESNVMKYAELVKGQAPDSTALANLLKIVAILRLEIERIQNSMTSSHSEYWLLRQG